MRLLIFILLTVVTSPLRLDAQVEDSLAHSIVNKLDSILSYENNIQKFQVDKTQVDSVMQVVLEEMGAFKTSETRLDSLRDENIALRSIMRTYKWEIDSLQVANILLKRMDSSGIVFPIHSGLYCWADAQGNTNWISITDSLDISYFIIGPESNIANKFKKMSQDKLYNKLQRKKTFKKIYASCKYDIEFDQRVLSKGRISYGNESNDYLPRLEFLFLENTLKEIFIAPDLNIDTKEFRYLGKMSP